MKKNVPVHRRQIRTTLYLFLAILLVVLPAFYDVASAGGPFTLLGIHDTLADVKDSDVSDALDEPFLSNYHLAFTTTCVPLELVRSLFFADETFFRQYLTLMSFTVRPPPIL